MNVYTYRGYNREIICSKKKTRVRYIYLPIHIKALADGLNSLARNPTANPKATPTMVKMTSRLVLTTSKHFIFAPDMFTEHAAADTLIQKEVAVVNP